VNAELVRDDGAAVTFAGYKLPVPADVLENKPGLADYLGKPVILGIRPSDFEDASLDNSSRGMMRVTAGVTEELGSEIMVIFTIDAPHVEHAAIVAAEEAAAELRSEVKAGRLDAVACEAVLGAALSGLRALALMRNPVAEYVEGKAFEELAIELVIVHECREAVTAAPVPDVPDERALVEELAVLLEESVAQPILKGLARVLHARQ